MGLVEPPSFTGLRLWGILGGPKGSFCNFQYRHRFTHCSLSDVSIPLCHANSGRRAPSHNCRDDMIRNSALEEPGACRVPQIMKSALQGRVFSFVHSCWLGVPGLLTR